MSLKAFGFVTDLYLVLGWNMSSNRVFYEENLFFKYLRWNTVYVCGLQAEGDGVMLFWLSALHNREIVIF